MNDYEAKVEARRARLQDRADRLATEGAAKVKAGRDALALIPFGQPILVGHHSEKADRSYRKRATGRIRAGYETMKAAEEVERRADAVGTGGVSSDDPDAVRKLRDQLARLEAVQVAMAEANKLVRKHKADPAAGVAALVKAGHVTEGRAAELFTPDCAGRLGFPAYALSNNNANVRRIKERIEQLMRNATRETKEAEHSSGVRIVENAEENRLQMFFPDKPPADVRAELKASGFRWSPAAGAWQRQLSHGAKWAAECVLKKMEP